MSFKLNARVAMFPFDGANPRLAETPNSVFRYPPNWSPLFSRAKCLATVHWSADLNLGLPLLPYVVQVPREDVSLSEFERGNQPSGTFKLDDTNGLSLDLTSYIDKSSLTVTGDNLFYVRATAQPATQIVELFAVDLMLNEIPGTRQRLAAAPGETVAVPVIFFGPGIALLRASAPVVLTSVVVGNLRNTEISWVVIATVAPTLRITAYNNQSYLYDLASGNVFDHLSIGDALNQRLWADSLARSRTALPPDKVLEDKVHRRDPRAAAANSFSNPWAQELEAHPDIYLADPGHTFSFSADLGNGQHTDVLLKPVELLQYFAAAGTAEACALGAGVTFPTTMPARSSLADMAQAFLDAATTPKPALPFPLVRIAGTFQTAPSSGSSTPGRVTIVSYGRPCWIDPPRAAYSQVGPLLQPTAKDGPAHADVEISFAQNPGPESLYLNRALRSSGVAGLLLDVNGDPKAVHPSDYTSLDIPKRISHLFDVQVALPLASSDVAIYTPIARDEFGRWRTEGTTDCTLPPWPVSSPTLLSAEIEYSLGGDVSLIVLASWNWTLRTPSQVRFGLALGEGEADPALDAIKPLAGLTAPQLGAANSCLLTFASDGTPSLAFHPPAPSSPIPTVELYPASGSPAPSIDERTYRLRLPIGGADALFAKRSHIAVAVIADAQEVVSGNRWSAPSTSLRKPILDPRPPRIPLLPWKLLWSSRSNAAKRSHVGLPLPPAVGWIKGFMVWQAHESSLLDLLLPGTSPDILSRLDSIRHESDMEVRLNLIEGLFENLDASTADFRKQFIALFEAASIEIYRGNSPEFELSSRQTGLEFFLLTAISETNVPSVKTDLACIYAVATPQAKPFPKPFLQVITVSDDDLFEVGSIGLLIVSSQDPFNAADVRVFWAKGSKPTSDDELFQRLNTVRPTSVSDVGRHIADLSTVLEKRPYPNVSLFYCKLPRLWESQYLTVDICSAARTKPADDVPSPRAPFVSCFSLPNTRPALTLSRSSAPSWTALCMNLPLMGGSANTPSEVILKYTSPSGSPPVLRSSPLAAFLGNPLTIQHADATITATYKASADETAAALAIEVKSDKPLNSQSLTLAARDPRGNVASLFLPR